jgi:hypothetical protein
MVSNYLRDSANLQVNLDGPDNGSHGVDTSLEGVSVGAFVTASESISTSALHNGLDGAPANANDLNQLDTQMSGSSTVSVDSTLCKAIFNADKDVLMEAIVCGIMVVFSNNWRNTTEAHILFWIAALIILRRLDMLTLIMLIVSFRAACELYCL